MKQWKVTHIVLLSTIICLTAIYVFSPLCKHGFIVTDDGGWMIIRLSAFYQAFADGQFPVRFLGRLNQNFGYPVANFLYPGYMYIGSIIHLFGVTFPDTVKVILISSYVISVVSIYLWLRKFFVGVWEAGIGALSFLLSPYFLFDTYVRGSVGEIVATAAFLFSLYTIENKKKLLLTPAIAFLIISHNTLALFYIVILLSYSVLRKSFGMIGYICIGVILSAFFWIPAFIERSIVAFANIVVSNPFQYFSVSHMLIVWSLPFCLACFYALIATPVRYKRERNYFILLFFGSLFFASTSSIVFWKMPLLIKFVQFPYRFLSIFTIAGIWLVSYAVAHVQKKLLKKILVCIGLFYLGYFAFLRINAVRIMVEPEGYYTTNEATTTVSDEYMPLWVKQIPQKRADHKLEWFKGNAQHEILYQSTKKIMARLVVYDDSILQINTIYYPGWGCAIDGRPTEIQYDNPMGIMRVFVPKGEHVFHIEFRETVFRFIADCISFIGLVFYLGILVRAIFSKIKKK